MSGQADLIITLEEKRLWRQPRQSSERLPSSVDPLDTVPESKPFYALRRSPVLPDMSNKFALSVVPSGLPTSPHMEIRFLLRHLNRPSLHPRSKCHIDNCEQWRYFYRSVCVLPARTALRDFYDCGSQLTHQMVGMCILS